MNNEIAFGTIRRLFDEQELAYNLIHHPAARTSEESARARSAAGFPDAVGAKALIVKCEFRDHTEYTTLVVPSRYRIDSRIVRASIQGLKKFRFLTVEEMHDVVQLSPGCMPPFGRNVFQGVSALFVDPRLMEYPQLGFNPAHLERSLIVSSADYLRVAKPTAIVALTSGEMVTSVGLEPADASVLASQ